MRGVEQWPEAHPGGHQGRPRRREEVLAPAQQEVAGAAGVRGHSLYTCDMYLYCSHTSREAKIRLSNKSWLYFDMRKGILFQFLNHFQMKLLCPEMQCNEMSFLLLRQLPVHSVWESVSVSWPIETLQFAEVRKLRRHGGARSSLHRILQTECNVYALKFNVMSDAVLSNQFSECVIPNENQWGVFYISILCWVGLGPWYAIMGIVRARLCWPTRASNEGYPKLPENSTIME